MIDVARSRRGSAPRSPVSARAEFTSHHATLGTVSSRDPKRRPTVVLFVRHGKTPTTGKVLPGQGRGLHLSDAGKEEAKQVAARIASLPPGTIAAIYASHLERAQETAAAIGEQLGLDVEVDPDLADCDTGDWTGKELKELGKLPAWREMRSWPAAFRFPGGEAMWQVGARVAGVVERLRIRHEGQVVVAVSHADPIKLAVGAALGSPSDFNDRLLVSTCSVTAISYSTFGPAVLTVSSTGDIATLGLGAPAK
jgi:broad specificity phosphatase PhoE